MEELNFTREKLEKRDIFNKEADLKENLCI